MASEETQIRLIGKELEFQGFEVSYNTRAPLSRDRSVYMNLDIAGIKYDENKEIAELRIVELVNKTGRTEEELIQRTDELSRVYGKSDQVSLEYRYLDTNESLHRRRLLRIPVDRVREELGRPLLRMNPRDPVRVTESALSYWWRWVRALRAIAERYGFDSTTDITALAESMAESKIIKRNWAEERKPEDGITISVICEHMLGVLEGQQASLKVANALRWHVRSLKRELKPEPRPRMGQRPPGKRPGP